MLSKKIGNNNCSAPNVILSKVYNNNLLINSPSNYTKNIYKTNKHFVYPDLYREENETYS